MVSLWADGDIADDDAFGGWLVYEGVVACPHAVKRLPVSAMTAAYLVLLLTFIAFSLCFIARDRVNAWIAGRS
jgi:hypothetical protein